MNSTQFTIAILGAGKIGRAVSHLLASSGRYKVLLNDLTPRANLPPWTIGPNTEYHEFDIRRHDRSPTWLASCSAIISCLPFDLSSDAASLAAKARLPYFDLTESIAQTRAVTAMAAQAGIPAMSQCGLAPGFVNIAAFELMSHFDQVKDLHLRVGALPMFPSNRLKYNLTWSTAGLLNQYVNDCEILDDGQIATVRALEGYETFFVDWEEYEAFNTSGGAGTLCYDLIGKVHNFSYKTIRYKGHRELMLFLLDDFGFRGRLSALADLLDSTLPTTAQDKVIIWAKARGLCGNELREMTRSCIVFPQALNSVSLSAIQIATAAGVCIPLDLHLNNKIALQPGGNKVHTIPLADFMENSFSTVYRSWLSTPGIHGMSAPFR